jgi:hypothetical protein
MNERVTHLTEDELHVLCKNEECRHGRWEHGWAGDDFLGGCGSEGSVPTADGDYAFIRCLCERFEP